MNIPRELEGRAILARHELLSAWLTPEQCAWFERMAEKYRTPLEELLLGAGAEWAAAVGEESRPPR